MKPLQNQQQLVPNTLFHATSEEYAAMTTLLIAVGSFVGFIVAYHTYGKWLSKKIFGLDRLRYLGALRFHKRRKQLSLQVKTAQTAK